MDTLYPYSAPRQLHPDLWEVTGTWKKTKFGRRMTVVRLQDGRLLIHNGIQLHEKELNWLKSLGQVAFIVGPNSFHCSDVAWMARRFPNAQVFVPAAKFKAYQEQGLRVLDLNRDFPTDIAGELRCLPMLGTRIAEAAFFHVPSRTLILCDLAFNMGDVFSGFEKWMMRWNKVGGRFGISRITKIFFTRDKQELVASYNRLMQLDFDRVIVNHGDVLEHGGKPQLQASVAEIFG